jgi:hypothetical protein
MHIIWKLRGTRGKSDMAKSKNKEPGKKVKPKRVDSEPGYAPRETTRTPGPPTTLFSLRLPANVREHLEDLVNPIEPGTVNPSPSELRRSSMNRVVIEAIESLWKAENEDPFDPFERRR